MNFNPEQLELELEYSDSKWRTEMEKDKDNWDSKDLYLVQLVKEKVYHVRVNAQNANEAQDVARRWSNYWDTIDKLDTWEKPTEVEDENFPQVKNCKLLEIHEHVQGVSVNG